MLNFIWLGLIGIAVLLGCLRGNIGDVGQSGIDSAGKAVEIAAGLIAVMTLWLGLMRLAEKAGLINLLGMAVRPILHWLFPEVPRNHPALGAITMNVAANILGLNNAATPLGLRAMNELEKLNKRPGVATNAMCMLLAINTSSITLIPVTVIALMAKFGSKNPTVIIGTSLAATAVAHVAAIAACKLLERTPWYRLPPLKETDVVALSAGDAKVDESKAATEGREVEEKAAHADATLPWVPHAGRILAAVGGIFLGCLFGIAFPHTLTAMQAMIDPRHFWLWNILEAFWLLVSSFPQLLLQAAMPHHWLPLLKQLIDAVSLILLPWLIVFFPLYASLRRIPVYDEFVEGGKEGFNVCLRILPNIVAILVAVGMFRTAGGMEILTRLLSPATDFLHFPSELVPLAVIRPFSGGASLGLLTDIMTHHPIDSLLVLMAGTLYGCSETTFYVIAVYFGSVGIRKTRHAIPAGLVADFIGPVASVIICRMVFT